LNIEPDLVILHGTPYGAAKAGIHNVKCKMHISEIFYSLQGEGFLVGTPSVFIRLAGCPLRCRWCDTKYAWSKEAGRQNNIDEIIRKIKDWPCNFVVVTGGEPMIVTDLPELVRKLKAIGKHVTVETAGIAYVPELPCDLMSISPKLSNSVPVEETLAAAHRDSSLDIAVLKELIDNYNYQLKFVVDSEKDLSEIEETIRKLETVDPAKVMLMPQASTREELLQKSPMVAGLCKHTGYTFCQRLHVLLWDNKRGT
jgi:7-carboxy-7-deazaguanine synthase